MTRSLQISVVAGDALELEVDVLALKYAQHLYGLDREVYTRLKNANILPKLPRSSDFVVSETNGVIRASRVLFVGVKPLREFLYTEVREFAQAALSSLAHIVPPVRHVALTLHGTGYGLDEIETFESEVAGIVDAVTAGEISTELETVTFVEMNPNRAERLSVALGRLIPSGRLPVEGGASIRSLASEAITALRNAGCASARKPHVFVAMPFAEEMDDVFHYGIQGAANSAGFLCERADIAVFTGDVMEWVKRRISTAKLVVADLSSANPNVYLEVGYAWGCRVPTVLLAKSVNDLKFDVKGQRCIIYKSIKHLEGALSLELVGLSSQF